MFRIGSGNNQSGIFHRLVPFRRQSAKTKKYPSEEVLNNSPWNDTVKKSNGGNRKRKKRHKSNDKNEGEELKTVAKNLDHGTNNVKKAKPKLRKQKAITDENDCDEMDNAGDLGTVNCNDLDKTVDFARAGCGIVRIGGSDTSSNGSGGEGAPLEKMHIFTVSQGWFYIICN